ncbi:hypothetical protein L249_7428, partial [Ophiocordyceps polyrhachis-furcata BCC 54312]
QRLQRGRVRTYRGHSGRVIAVIAARAQLSDSGYLYTFNLFFTAFLFTFRPTNYLIRTALRIDSLLIREKLQGALGSIAYNKSEDALALIRLQLEDGPLTQIMHLRSAKEAWDKLKDLYNPVSQGYAL